MSGDIYVALVIILFVVNGIRSLVKALTPPPPASPQPRPTGSPAPQQQPVSMQVAQQRPLAGPYGAAQPSPGQPQQRLMQAAEGERQASPRPNRGATPTPRLQQSLAAKAPPVRSQAPMSETALQFAQERQVSDQEFAVAAQTLIDNDTATNLRQGAIAGPNVFLTGRYPLLDAIILNEAFGRPVCMRSHR